MFNMCCCSGEVEIVKTPWHHFLLVAILFSSQQGDKHLPEDLQYLLTDPQLLLCQSKT